MPLFLVVPICMVVLGYFIWKKVKFKPSIRSLVKLFVCTVTWFSITYQFINIAHYIDDSGEKIVNILGNYGLVLSWTSLTLFSVYLIYIYIDFLAKKTKS